jgi:BCD family chlorophyll transporter-like MFS transporter
MLTLASLMQIEALMMPSLYLLGIGLGFWNIGTLGLMMDMSPVGRAGTFLGFWSMSVTLARGGGITSGGIVRDLGLFISDNHAIAYGLVFGGAFIGLIVAYWCLNSIHVDAYKSEQISQSERTATVLAGAMD